MLKQRKFHTDTRIAPLFLSLLNRKDGLQHILSRSLVVSSLLSNEMHLNGVINSLSHTLEPSISLANKKQITFTAAGKSPEEN